MTDFPKPQVRTIKDEPLWREANAIADYMFEKMDDFPESEKWYTVNKLRLATLDMLFYTAEALGGTILTTTEAEWSNARKAVTALRTIYPFSARQHFVELEPSIVVRLDKMLKAIDAEVHSARAWFDGANEADLDHWREKYNIWKKIDDK